MTPLLDPSTDLIVATIRSGHAVPVYRADAYPVEQWDYWLFHRENFVQSAADVPATIAALYRAGSPDALAKPAKLASVLAQGRATGLNRLRPSAREP